MKNIKDYIQFAINNGLDKYNFEFDIIKDYEIMEGIKIIRWYKRGYSNYEEPIEKLITSKPFIEAIVRGILKNYKKYKFKDVENGFNILVRREYLIFGHTFYAEYFSPYKDGSDSDMYKLGLTDLTIIDIIIKEQGFAIFNDSMEEYINNLLPN